MLCHRWTSTDIRTSASTSFLPTKAPTGASLSHQARAPACGMLNASLCLLVSAQQLHSCMGRDSKSWIVVGLPHVCSRLVGSTSELNTCTASASSFPSFLFLCVCLPPSFLCLHLHVSLSRSGADCAHRPSGWPSAWCHTQTKNRLSTVLTLS
jgi:hypothetical protein